MAKKTDTQEFGMQVYKTATTELRASVPKIIVNMGVAILIWLVGNFVFIPISQTYFIGTFAVTQLISLIILVALLLLVVGIAREIGRVAEAAAGFLAYSIGGKKGDVTPEELRNYNIAIKGILYVLIVAVAFLLFASQLTILHPALAAILLVAVVAWSIVSLYRSGRALSNTVQEYANRWAERLEQTLKS